MRFGAFFWGGILILFGLLLLMSNLGIITVNIWGIFWPSLLILLGVWVLFGVYFRRRPESQAASVPLDGVGQAYLRLDFGAGRLRLNPGAGTGQLLDGDFGGGVKIDHRKAGDRLDVHLNLPVQVWDFPFFAPNGLEWDLRLADDVALDLDLRMGAGEARLDLGELLVKDLKIQTGASSTDVTLPASAGMTRVLVSSGAASIKIHVPQDVAARIQSSSGLASITIDHQRFPRLQHYNQSPDYETAANKVDIKIETGVSSVEVM